MRDGSLISDGDPAPVGDVFNKECPGRMIVEHITGRWSTLIIAALKPGPLRFFELRDKIDGVSEKMLSQKLRLLVRDGLIDRTVEPSVPPKVSYELSELGRGVSRPLDGLVRWIAANGHAVLAAQARHDKDS
ncbi:winged helix-turn-helix transcriptional regulator [Amycolatopsis sp. NPDC059657]|uniref:winged helix-turn-helix transcriptional regulator n=1 Tax=Amycolatopsis sp. NPDC059657 TaxID=3346899 RepID=UPI003670FE42